MKLSVASIVALVALFSQALAVDVQHCGGPKDLKCRAGSTCCGPVVNGVGTCVPGTAAACKVPFKAQNVKKPKKHCGGANEPKCHA